MKLTILATALLLCSCTTIEITSKDGKVVVEAGKTFNNTQSMAADGNTVPLSTGP